LLRLGEVRLQSRLARVGLYWAVSLGQNFYVLEADWNLRADCVSISFRYNNKSSNLTICSPVQIR
jgi:hypothetical protein